MHHASDIIDIVLEITGEQLTDLILQSRAPNFVRARGLMYTVLHDPTLGNLSQPESASVLLGAHSAVAESIAHFRKRRDADLLVRSVRHCLRLVEERQLVEHVLCEIKGVRRVVEALLARSKSAVPPPQFTGATHGS